MPVPGQAGPPAVAPGAAKLIRYQAAGFTPQELAKYQADKTQEYLRAGFTPQEIDAYWGTQQPHSPEVAAHVSNNIQRSGILANIQGAIRDAGAAFEAGWGTSVAGIAEHIATGQDPNKAFQVQASPGFVNHAAALAGSTAGDLVSMFGGAVAGATAGAAIPGVGETGLSEVVGGLAGGFGAGAAPQGMREVMMDAYNRGQIKNVGDLLHVMGISTIRTLQAGVESAPFGLAGPIAGKLTKLGAGKVTAAVGGVGGATALGVGTGAALNHRVPDAQDAVAAAVTMLVVHGGVKVGTVAAGVFKPSPATLHVANNLEEIYRRNGTAPWDAINAAKTDPGLRQEILQQDVNGNSVAPRTHANAPAEPPPIHGAQEAETGLRPMKNVTPKAEMPEGMRGPKPAPIVKSFEDLSTALEGSRDDQVSPKGAIGRHQIMIGTARQYGYGEGMSQAELAQWLHDPNNNAKVFHSIAADLHARFHGDMNAMLIAYNAGPGMAGKYLTKGPGTELEAIPDPKARGGIRYESVPSARDESFLPMETQKYLANGRRRSGGATEAGATEEAAGGPPALRVFPSEENHAEEEEGAGGGSGGGGEGGGKGGGGEPPEEPPALSGPGSDDYWKKASYDQAVDEIMANVGEPKKGTSWLDLLSPSLLKQQLISELAPARNIDSALVREGTLDRNRDVGQEDMFRQTYASDSRAGAFLRYGILRLGRKDEITIEPDSPSGEKAVDAVHEDGGTMRGWVAYMLSKRTLDKDKQGIKTGFNLGASERVVTDAEAAKYERGTEILNKVMTGGLEYARDSGYLSQAQVDAMVRDNPTYISMRRIMGDDESFGTGRKGFVPREALKVMEGSDRSIVEPIHATLDNLRVLVAMADRNRAIGSIIGQVEAGKLQNLGLEKIEDLSALQKTSSIFKPYGLGKKGADDPNVTYSPLLAERAQKGLGPNEFIYYRDGVPERWKATSPALADLIRKATSPGEVNIFGKVFDTIASLDRAGIVLDPSFPTRISLRHQITAFIADPMHPKPFITMLSGLHDAFTGKGVFPEWLANGGAAVALADMDVKWFQRDMEQTFQDQGVYERMWNRVQHPIEAFQWVAERLDAAARIGYFKEAKAQGLSPLKAATMSRKAYLDYAERASLAAVNSLARKVPFLRPKLLGLKQFGEAFAGKPWETFAYTGATVSGVASLLYAANYFYDKSLPDGHDDEKFGAVPRWIRDTHWVTPPIAGARIQFPFPPVVGTFFGGLMNRFLDSWQKSDPHAFDGWAHSLIADYDPKEMIPVALKTPLEAASNYNYFTGKPIVPASVQAADGYMQYTNATTEPSKAVSRWLGKPGLNVADFSPIQLEYFLRGWTGDIGMGVLRAVNGRLTDYQPPMQMADIPAVGTFFVRNPQMHAQQIEDFYTDLSKMEAAHADWSLALKHQDQWEISQAAKGPFYGLKTIGRIDAVLKVMSAAVASINKSTEVPAAQKSQDTDQIVSAMVQLSIMGSGIAATMQGQEPSQAFKDMDKNAAMSTLVRMPTQPAMAQ